MSKNQNPAEKPLVSKYASKHPKGEFTLVASVSAPAVIDRREIPDSLIDDIEKVIMGETKYADFQEVGRLRSFAYSRMSEVKSTNHIDIEVGRLANLVPWEVEKSMFNALRRKYQDQSGKNWEIVEADFKKAQSERRPEFVARVEAVIKGTPSLEREHNANLAKAEALQVANSSKLEEATAAFERANAIASAYGWPLTAKKEKVNEAK